MYFVLKLAHRQNLALLHIRALQGKVNYYFAAKCPLRAERSLKLRKIAISLFPFYYIKQSKTAKADSKNKIFSKK